MSVLSRNVVTKSLSKTPPRALTSPRPQCDDYAMTTITHSMIANRFLDIIIDNAPDEMHDRDRDDYAATIDPLIDPIRTLAHAAHDAICTDASLFDCDSLDDLDDIAFELLDDDLPACIAPIHDALMTLLYAAPARDLL